VYFTIPWRLSQEETSGAWVCDQWVWYSASERLGLRCARTVMRRRGVVDIGGVDVRVGGGFVWRV
jgi:hypothetical protein